MGITQNLASDIYLDDTSDIQFLRVDAEIQDTIRIGGTGSTTTTNVQAGAIATAGDATKLNGRIASVLVTNGNALGDIKAVSGSIGTIDATAGSIGAASAPIAIEAAAASGGIHIVRVNASQHIYSNVDCNTSTPQADGVIETFFAGNGASPSTTGDFHGSLRLGSFNEQVTIVRDLYGTIEYGTTLPAGSPSQPKEIIIGRSLKSGAQVNFPANGLQGHVGINRVQSAGGVWESGATVNVGAVALTAYNYSDTAASIGGGSAGLISYRLHNSSCSPVNGGTALTACSTHPSVRLRHYGPLQWTTGLPTSVSRRLACTSDSFTSVSVSASNFALDDDNPSATEPQRTLVVTLPFDVGYEYKITPTANLRSFGAGSGNPSVVWDSDYLFTVWPACYTDVVATGTVDIDDLLAVISAWGPCPTPPTACPADIVPLACGNDAVDIDDLLAVIAGYGPCPSCESEGSGFSGGSSGGGSGAPPEIDWEYFIDCLSNGTPEEQEACLAELAELLTGS